MPERFKVTPATNNVPQYQPFAQEQLSHEIGK